MRDLTIKRDNIVWGKCCHKEQQEAIKYLEEGYVLWIDENPKMQGKILGNGISVCNPSVLKELDFRPFVLVLGENPRAQNALLEIGYIEDKDFRITGKVPSLTKKHEDKKITETHGYYSGYQDEEHIPEGQSSVKAVAFYLPQFHTFPENDKWWGKGFTEWTNTSKAKPLYEGHYQPRTPHEDMGYYDLSRIDVLKWQAELAKRHGIYGFCFYYYWFSGHRLMEKPLDILLSHPEIDINYCLCWANENWTRRWDGRDQDVLIAQKYLPDDPERFILDIKKYLLDSRYTRVYGRPVILVYELGKIPNAKDVFLKWKHVARECGIGEISIWGIRVSGNTARSLGLENLVEREVEFPPRDLDQMAGTAIQRKVVKGIEGRMGRGADYAKTVGQILDGQKKALSEKVYRTVMLGWDNTPRCADFSFFSFDNFDLKTYYDWLRACVEETERRFKPEEQFVFINAWNEWGEGTYLEPDQRFGYAAINTTSRALWKQNFWMEMKVRTRIAVQVHVYYTDLVKKIIEHTNWIDEPFDLYISTDNCTKAGVIREELRYSRAAQYHIIVMDNRGRDVMPLLLQMKHCYLKYEYLLHIHTKKSEHLSKAGKEWAEEWREYLYQSVLPNREGVGTIIQRFDTDKKLGILYPSHFKKLRHVREHPESCQKEVTQLLQILHVLDDGRICSIEFPSGNMFWARTKAVKDLFDGNLTYDDFPQEQGQLDGTLMHAVERSWCKVAAFNGYRCEKI